MDRLNGYILQNVETLRRAIRFHVKIAMGSDAVFTGFGENTGDLRWFVKPGMTPAQALDSATSVGARVTRQIEGTWYRCTRRLRRSGCDRRRPSQGHYGGSQGQAGHEGRQGRCRQAMNLRRAGLPSALAYFVFDPQAR